ncbi:Coenzyme F420-reducing hydrogenase, beta subunit [Pseudobutyrivibrio sp. ACV-2]|uniref:Coenzyme F420 hydrogenase/dehydrogenase, beta subunit C-terminal domain n=1 Tax=Pseudobutyrivibrio sp. ACV-2 TaxID=1520801 RepID=UPI00089CA9B5|nr:Coenzyme F420 hydrogenase/dehydrogenase, beta subunit C-terminal domain [Pseudobutyrivibrio sp. ACV-2]SEA01853.1 Coenzyme F420-reducing hydrogenase, beta subunit [Pseudobutyrivibrio sp. ACV-2]
MKICENSKCTACGACRDACPKGCISFVKNEYGAETVVIDEKLCINCGRCSHVCQVVNPVEKKEPIISYAVCLKDLKKRNASASGGAAYALYSKIIEEGGVAYGATYSDKNVITFKKTDNIEDIAKFQGSKYTYSDMVGTYKEIIEDLRQGRTVIFIGTSCQCAGIKKFVPEVMQKNLYLTDIICHGMPPAAYYSEYIEELDTKYGHIDEISFRDNNKFRFKAVSNGNTVVEDKAIDNLFMSNYTRKVFYRDNCYSCDYACAERISDITIGDYWGKDRFEPTDKGMSVVICNTEKGVLLFEKCKNDLFFTLKKYIDIVKTNEQLRGPSEKPYYRDIFLNEYKKNGFMYASSMTRNKITDDLKKSRHPFQKIKRKIKHLFIG